MKGTSSTLPTAAVFCCVLLLVCAGEAASPKESGHPRLFFAPEDIPALREKIKSRPCSEWWRGIKKRADAGLKKDLGANIREEDRASLACPLAFAWIVTGRRIYADKAKQILDGAKGWPNDLKRFYGTTYGRPRALIQYIAAYDWIANSAADAEEANRLRDKMGDLAGKEYEALLRHSTTTATYLASRRISADCALGTFALALPGYAHPVNGSSARWLRYVLADLFSDPIEGRHQLGRYFDRNVAPGGVYQANVYQNEAMYCFPFFIALKRLGGPSTGSGRRRELQWSNGGGREHPDYLNTRIKEMFDSNIKLMMPNGLQPTFDCGWMQGMLWHDLVAYIYPNGGEHLWYHERARANRFKVRLRPMSPDLDIVFFKRDVKPTQPKWTTQFIPGSGVAVFRENWSYDANYMLLLAENLPATSSHENPDQTAFLIHAKGAYLAIDPGDGRGYGGWDSKDRLWIYSAKAHNLVIVDDRNSPTTAGNPVRDQARLGNRLSADFLDYAEATLTYSAVGVETTRAVLFPRKAYFIIADDLRSDAEHRYDWQIHFGDVTKGRLAMSAGRVSWRTANDSGQPVELAVAFIVPEHVEITRHKGPTNYLVHGSRTFEHAYIKATAKGRNVRYLTVLYPRKLTEAEAKIDRVAEGGVKGAKISLVGRTDYVSLGGGIGKASGSKGELVFASVVKDERPGDGRLDYFMVKNGTSFRFEDKEVWSSPEPVTAALRLRDGKLVGKVCGDKGEGEPFVGRSRAR